jgi:hypothetical protein
MFFYSIECDDEPSPTRATAARPFHPRDLSAAPQSANSTSMNSRHAARSRLWAVSDGAPLSN